MRIINLSNLDGSSLIPSCAITSIDNQSQQSYNLGLLLFPNPTKDEVHIRLTNSLDNQMNQILVYDSKGIKIINEFFSSK